ncbi:MAG TPA: Hsp20/alpha crystallin family protein [Parvularculaceae bacterium]|nr:Hsp20/alpha crystallin family protein [Parvularculaceae bacterium]
MTKEMMKSTSPAPRGWLDPFESLPDDVEKFFTPYFRRFALPTFGLRGDGGGRLFANLDLSETDNELIVEIDSPGVRREDIDITLTDNALSVRGKREAKKEEKEKNAYRLEREYGSFERRIALPCEVDAEHVDAGLKNGVLTIKLPKTAKAKEQARKIEIHN